VAGSVSRTILQERPEGVGGSMSIQDFDLQSEKRAMEFARAQLQGMRNVSFTQSAGLAPVLTETERKRHKAKLDETRQLKRPGADYLTGLEPSGEVLEDWDMNIMPFKWQIAERDKRVKESQDKGVDFERFKQECAEINR